MTTKKTVNDLSNEDKSEILHAWVTEKAPDCADCPLLNSEQACGMSCYSFVGVRRDNACIEIITAAARQITAPLYDDTLQSALDCTVTVGEVTTINSDIPMADYGAGLPKKNTEDDAIKLAALRIQHKAQSESIERLAESIEQRDEIIERQNAREHVTNRMIVELHIELERLREGVE